MKHISTWITSNVKHLRWFYIFWFQLFGLGLFIFLFVYQGYLFERNLEHTLQTALVNESNRKATQIQNDFQRWQIALKALNKSNSMSRYLSYHDSVSKERLRELMWNIVSSDRSISQCRIIDENGFEKIRIERKSFFETPQIIDERILQNKKDRYYFQQTLQLKPNQIWISKLDLNVEHNQIEKPYVPTLRMAMPLYEGGIFKGIVIVNLFMKPVLDNVLESSLFDISLIDQDGYMLVSSQFPERQWERYLRDTKSDTKDAIKGELFSLAPVFRNDEKILMYMSVKHLYLNQKHRDFYVEMGLLLIILGVIAFPLSYFFVKIPITLYSDLKHSQESLQRLSITDELSGLYNRRYFNHIIPIELSRAYRDRQMIAFAIFDIDYFKNYNDHYGHIPGDTALQKVARAMKSHFRRSEDLMFRIGGEEFAAFYQCETIEEAITVANNIIQTVENLAIEHKHSGISDVLTVSGGLYVHKGTEPITLNDLYRFADRALYRAKENGRNCVVVDINGENT